MNGVELFLLGRTLMKIGEQALPETGHRTGNRAVLVVLSDILEHADTTISEIATRTGLPQSAVSGAVSRLRETGSVVAEPDPADRRRTLLRRAGRLSTRVAEVRATTIDDALTRALGAGDPVALAEVTAALDTLSRHLRAQPSDG
ncbi:MarR family winged helix-turn-helix transcriptional regulator [Nocardia jejuensis]|uniref:MarR family winged helix-turn-helix transcriptional regulator n=1 Tax=Nocardia jejuensis TaxID=328049 RepID=UPI000832520F|nr:helix-turn-helix domain-containing protein [Nocardia jejuensis]